MLSDTLVVISGDAELAERVADNLAAASRGPRPLSLVQMGEDATDRAVLDAAASASVVVADANWRSSCAAAFVSGSSLVEMQAAFDDAKRALPVMTLLGQLRAGFRQRAPRDTPVAVVMADGPSAAFTQLALVGGADWVWPSRLQLSQFEQVVRRLQQLNNENPLNFERRPRVIVLENSDQDIATLEIRLSDLFELSFVGVDHYSAKDLTVTADAAMEHYRSRGPFDAAIVDLALTDENEKKAGGDLGTEEAARRGMLSDDGSGLAGTLQGIEFIKRLLDGGADVAVVVMSNFVSYPAVLGRINLLLGPHMKRVSLLEKKDRAYDDLRALLVDKISTRN